jgi:hypothetical protein
MHDPFKQPSHLSPPPRYPWLSSQSRPYRTRTRAREVSPADESLAENGRFGKNPIAPVPNHGHRPQFSDRPPPRQNAMQDPDFRVGLDFGATFSCLTWWKKGTPERDIYTVEGFPGNRCLTRNGTQVPTESCYLIPKDPWPGVTPPETYRYGYEVQRFFELPETDDYRVAYGAAIRIEHMKLLLFDDPRAKGYREELRKALDLLKTAGLIKHDEEVVIHLLTKYFMRTKRSLEEHGLHDQSTGESHC